MGGKGLTETCEGCDNGKPVVPEEHLPLVPPPNPASRDQSGQNQRTSWLKPEWAGALKSNVPETGAKQRGGS